jgi:hypothetical protein
MQVLYDVYIFAVAVHPRDHEMLVHVQHEMLDESKSMMETLWNLN